MRYSSLFGKTFREIPHGLKAKSQILLVQGGYVRFLGQGLYSLLPLGLLVIRRLEKMIRNEMEALGGQEVQVPLVNPYDIWKRGGRERFLGDDLAKFSDRLGRYLVLSPSHEEAMVELVRAGLRSYRDLPIFLYQFQTKFRDEKKTRSGLIRAREFVMKDAYSFHRTYYELNNFFPQVFAAYQRIFDRCGVEYVTAEGSVGFMGGEKAYEFLMPAQIGENIVVMCDNCGYKANAEIAKAIKVMYPEEPLDVEPVETDGCITMDLLARKLKLPRRRLAKAVVYKTAMRYVMAIVRSDYEISEEKLALALGEPILGLASDEALCELDLIKGHLSPIGRNHIYRVADDSVTGSNNLVYGANVEKRHLLNVNYGRDFEADLVADIARAGNGLRCLQCHHKLTELRAIELGNIFKLNDFYTKPMDLQFRDERGNMVFPQMGSYGIGLGRLMSAVVEANHDERGIAWPPHLAPFPVFLMGIGKSPSVRKAVEDLYAKIQTVALLDDRRESPGVKFNDCELIGIPLRVVISARLLEQGKAEIYRRDTGQSREVGVEEVPAVVSRFIESEGINTLEDA
ncbi:MAG: proline--tRNA ligase [Spirochaetales bacterium]|nr:proline--tRNA ligase [Spirochaetales bacterium]